MKKKIILALALVQAMSLSAQTTGIIVDENKEPLVSATVSLYRVGNDKPLAGVFTDIDGKFELNTQKGQDYVVKITFLGYTGQTIECRNVPGKFELGTISMEPESHTLNGVTVTANKRCARQTGKS